MISEDQIRGLVEEKIEGTSFFLVELNVASGNKISVELDGDGGISIDDCVEISRHIEFSLDRETEDFSLQVSSAGLDKPLRHRRQFVKNIGREVRVTTEEGLSFEGELKSADEKLVLGLKPSKKKKLPARDEEIDWNNVKETKIIISFK